MDPYEEFRDLIDTMIDTMTADSHKMVEAMRARDRAAQDAARRPDGTVDWDKVSIAHGGNMMPESE